MIGTSKPEYYFIRFCIIGLHYLAPLCLSYCAFAIGLYGFKTAVTYPVPLVIESLAVAESLFFLFVYVPYRYYLQRDAVHPPAPSLEERRELFQLCNDNISDPEAYLQKWFLGADSKEIKRENFKEFLLWAFFNRGGLPGEDDEELEEYVVATEKLLGRPIEQGVESSDPNNQVGIIAIEIMPVSFRICPPALGRVEMCTEINKILTQHFGPAQKVVLVSHSYGTVITTHLLKTPAIAERIGPVVLIDPVSILLHLPDVAYNFTRRQPQRANEHQLYYFASMDMGVSHTLSRHFFWNENVLWKKDFKGRKITVSLGGRDLIVDTNSVGRYFAKPDNSLMNGHAKLGHQTSSGILVDLDDAQDSAVEGSEEDIGFVDEEEWKSRSWTGEGIDILWFKDLDHAQVFDKPGTRKMLISAIRSYCEET